MSTLVMRSKDMMDEWQILLFGSRLNDENGSVRINVPIGVVNLSVTDFVADITKRLEIK